MWWGLVSVAGAPKVGKAFEGCDVGSPGTGCCLLGYRFGVRTSALGFMSLKRELWGVGLK